MIKGDYVAPSLLLILGGCLLMVGSPPWSIIGGISATIGAAILIWNLVRYKWLHRHPFREVKYLLEDDSEHDRKEPITMRSGRHRIRIMLKPRIKYTVSGASVAFSRNLGDAVGELKFWSFDDRRSPHYDWGDLKHDGLKITGYYGPHRAVGKDDTVTYAIDYEVSGLWQGELSLRIITEEFGRGNPVVFKCIEHKRNG